jgi:hypothetical protein
MIEVIAFALGVAALIMGWKYITRFLDWIASSLGKSGSAIELGVDQAVIVSYDARETRLFNAQRSAAERAKEKAKFTSKLSEEEKREVENFTKGIESLIG